MSDDDVRLREHFDALRRSDAARAPGVAATLAAAHARPERPRVSVWLAGAAAAGLALLWLSRFAPPPDAPLPPGTVGDFAVGSWRMPTDVLLDTPGSELLGTPGWEPLAAPGPDGLGPRSRVRPTALRGRSHG